MNINMHGRSICQQGEDLIRESGIPYTIVRPCALTEEPAGADLIFDQGDNITVCFYKPSPFIYACVHVHTLDLQRK